MKILTAWTLKNSQSSVTLKNECKQLCYYFPNEIKNSTHLNEKILRLKQQAKFETINKNIFVHLFVFKLWTNIKFQNVSLRRYDTIKTCWWNFFKFSCVVHYRKIWKSRFKNRGALYAKLNERAEAATSSYSVKGDFLQYIYLVAVTKNLQNIQSRCLVHEFSFTDIFQQY